MALVSEFKFAGMNNVADPLDLAVLGANDRAYQSCADIVNCDIDNSGNASRREGSTLAAEGTVASSWGNDSEAYCVVDGAVNSFDGEALTPVPGASALGAAEFLQVNDVTVFSDNATFGVISDGAAEVVSNPVESVDILDLESWVKIAYPKESDSIKVDAFRIATLAGRCLEFYNGRVYLAVDNFIYCTKAFDAAHMDTRYNVVAGFSAPVTMIKAVKDGLYVGTEKGAYFLAGQAVYVADESAVSITRGFTQEQLLPFGVVYGSAVTVPADKVTPLKAEGKAVVWLTSNGVYAGADGGRYLDLTADRVRMPVAQSSASLVRQVGEAWQYVACPGADEDTIAVNLSTAAHSRFQGFAYNGLFLLGGKAYGSSEEGVFLLEGDLDYGTLPVEAYAVTPTADFNVAELKRVSDAYVQARTEGDLTLDVYIDEVEVATELPFSAPCNLADGARRLRAKLPRGVKGTNWQFRIANVDGCRFTIFSLKAAPVASSRTI